MSNSGAPCETPTLEIAELLRQVNSAHSHGDPVDDGDGDREHRHSASTPVQQQPQQNAFADLSSWVRAQTPGSVSRGATPTLTAASAAHGAASSPFASGGGLTSSTVAGQSGPFWSPQRYCTGTGTTAAHGSAGHHVQPRSLLAAMTAHDEGSDGVDPSSCSSLAAAAAATTTPLPPPPPPPLMSFIPTQLFSDLTNADDEDGRGDSNDGGGSVGPETCNGTSGGGFVVRGGRRLPVTHIRGGPHGGLQSPQQQQQPPYGAVPSASAGRGLFAPLDFAYSNGRGGGAAAPTHLTPIHSSAARSLPSTPFTFTPPPQPQQHQVDAMHHSQLQFQHPFASPSSFHVSSGVSPGAGIGLDGANSARGGELQLRSNGSIGNFDCELPSPMGTGAPGSGGGPHSLRFVQQHGSLYQPPTPPQHHHQHHVGAAASVGCASSSAAGASPGAPPPPPPLPPFVVPTTAAEIVAATRDQCGCRQLQHVVESQPFDSPEVSRIVEAIEPIMAELMADQYGNFLFQKIHDAADDATRFRIMQVVVSRMASVAATQHGTFAVQKLVDSVRTQEEELLVTGGIRAQLRELMTDNHGSHVIQRLLTSLGSSEKRQFIFDGLAAQVHAISCDKYGCCIVQKCIDAADDSQLHMIAESVLETVVAMASDAFGNYVVQKLIAALTGEQSSAGAPQLHSPSGPVLPHMRQQELLDSIGGRFAEHAESLSVNRFASKCVELSVRHSSEAVATNIISTIARDQALLRRIAGDQFGNYIVQTMLTYGPVPTLPRLLDALVPIIGQVSRAACIGRKIEAKCEIARYRLEHNGELPPHHHHQQQHHHHQGFSPTHGGSPHHGMGMSPAATPQRSATRRNSGNATPLQVRPVMMQALAAQPSPMPTATAAAMGHHHHHHNQQQQQQHHAGSTDVLAGGSEYASGNAPAAEGAAVSPTHHRQAAQQPQHPSQSGNSNAGRNPHARPFVRRL